MKNLAFCALLAALFLPGCQGTPRLPEQSEPPIEESLETSSLGDESTGFLADQSEPDRQ